MKFLPVLEKAGAYVSAHLKPSDGGWSVVPEGPFVTISREAGAGASSLAQLLARRLDARAGVPWTVFDGNLIESMLEANEMSPGLARFLPEARVSEIEAIIGETIGLHPSLWELVQKANELMRRLAQTGQVILVGRGANFATASVRSGVHVRLVASAEYRAKVMAERHHVSVGVAGRHNRREDRARRGYVREHFGAKGPDPIHYDLVINTGRVPLDEAAEHVASLVRARAPARE